MPTPVTTKLYYTKADLQYRYWVLADLIADKGAHFCCEKTNGSEVPQNELNTFSKAVAYLTLICEYTSLAELKYAGDTQAVIDATNCISEDQMDAIIAWFENYFCISFLPKEMAPVDSEGGLDLSPPVLSESFIDADCFLSLENGYLILLEDGSRMILEDATCNPPLIPALIDELEGNNLPNF
jgi:hypothetical protein